MPESVRKESARNGNCREWKLQGMETAGNGNCKEWKLQGTETAGNGNCREWKLKGKVFAEDIKLYIKNQLL